MRLEKKSAADEIRSKVSGAGYIILADYKGLSVARTSELRRRLRGANAKMQVVKNRLFGLVAKDLGYQGMQSTLAGPSAMVYGSGDVVTTAKVLRDFIKENDKKPVIKAGALQGRVISPEEVASLAALPGREQLLGQVVGTIAAPMSRLVGVLNQKICSLLYVLQAAKDKKEKSA
jgi:large subunit ribosomal protein L10